MNKILKLHQVIDEDEGLYGICLSDDRKLIYELYSMDEFNECEIGINLVKIIRAIEYGIKLGQSGFDKVSIVSANGEEIKDGEYLLSNEYFTVNQVDKETYYDEVDSPF